MSTTFLSEDAESHFFVYVGHAMPRPADDSAIVLLSASVDHVQNVIGLGAHKKVGGIAAWGIIARMSHDLIVT